MLSHGLAAATEADYTSLKHFGRYPADSQDIGIELWTDSTSAKAIGARQGVGLDTAERIEEIVESSDSDCANDEVSRRPVSTSG
eukprot:3542625-Heterocapsa_arctica.AAC.1